MRSAVDEDDAEYDKNDSNPARHGNLFVQKQVREEWNQGVGDRRKRHYETVVCPGEDEHVAHHEA